MDSFGHGNAIKEPTDKNIRERETCSPGERHDTIHIVYLFRTILFCLREEWSKYLVAYETEHRAY